MTLKTKVLSNRKEPPSMEMVKAWVGTRCHDLCFLNVDL